MVTDEEKFTALINLRDEKSRIVKTLERVSNAGPPRLAGSDEEKPVLYADLIIKGGNHQVLRARLAEIERGLAALANNTWGKCDKCQEEIPPERRKKQASAVRCITCQKETEPRKIAPGSRLRHRR